MNLIKSVEFVNGKTYKLGDYYKDDKYIGYIELCKTHNNIYVFENAIQYTSVFDNSVINYKGKNILFIINNCTNYILEEDNDIELIDNGLLKLYKNESEEK